ncbi:hypothetical protein O6H91_18G058600 [Diphasiastrum complanatum]|uniref:Uncharacterized protein n=1 Tax=Diphasiastrum complanatum TaxID=34168 RepID=A0ACC2B2S7_DIPCM|nr:hypothetical protein O6H91_Y310300 [Diphasiastrum complanatum]KAJ7523697.1 hypothetical protein O6H91_18G058600 [Diphasiastrum complanatum]
MEVIPQCRPDPFSKRRREPDMIVDELSHSASLSCKRHCGEMLAPGDLVNILEIDDLQNGNSNDDYLDTATQEELVCGVMRSLEEEIGASDCSASSKYSLEECMPSALEESWCCLPSEDCSLVGESSFVCISSPKSLNEVDEARCSDYGPVNTGFLDAQCSDYGCVDIDFLLQASDDQLGLSQSPCHAVEDYDESGSVLGSTCPEESVAVDLESWQSENVWSLENALEFPCVDECADQDWLKRAVATLEILMVPSSTQSSVQESSLAVLEAGVGS